MTKRSRILVCGIAVVLAACDDIERGGPAPSSPAMVALGRALFFDPALSADGTIACATCHQPAHAYADGLAHASGIAGRQGTRNAPSIIDVGLQHSLFWDGRRTRLEDQALDPLLNEVEHGLASEADLIARLHRRSYAAGFAEAFAGDPRSCDPISGPHVAKALAAFERTLVSLPAAFDRFRAGDPAAISEAARRGWVVFNHEAHCTRCHLADGALPLFTDHEFHSLAIGFDTVERKLPALTTRLRALHADGRPLGREVLLDHDLAELGRFTVTLEPRDLGAFKTPGLRNVARTAPYMHDGSVATLEEAVDLEVYSRGAHDRRPIILTRADRSDLIAFLATLTGDVAGPSAADSSASQTGSRM